MGENTWSIIAQEMKPTPTCLAPTAGDLGKARGMGAGGDPVLNRRGY
jgi:hypothetical protein